MLNKRKRDYPAIVAAVLLGLLGVQTPAGLASDLYEIVAGSYTECCGFAGTDSGYDLPDKSQAFVRFSSGAEGETPRLTFLAADAQTVFSVVPCLVPGAVQFDFDHGVVLEDRVVFHVDPGPPPLSLFWHYTVTNAAEGLHLDGIAGITQGACADSPTRFGHTNVVAVLVPPPIISVEEFSETGILLRVQGQANWIDVVLASTDLVNWTPISTNTMPATLCPTCPFILVPDPESTQLGRRYYRASESPGPPPPVTATKGP